jgi:uncharacterized protein YecT (DUF1311 family)
MRRWLTALTLAVLSFAANSSAFADPFESPRPDLLRACVAEAGAERSAVMACLGASAHPCVATEGGATMGYMLCWDAEATTWRELIAEASAALTTQMSYRSPEQLAAANEAWSRWADAECEYWAWEEGGGVGEQVDRARCHARVSAERVAALLEAGAAR